MTNLRVMAVMPSLACLLLLSRPGLLGDLYYYESEVMMTKTKRLVPAEVRDRAAHLVVDYQGEQATQRATLCSIAAKIGCSRDAAQTGFLL